MQRATKATPKWDWSKFKALVEGEGGANITLNFHKIPERRYFATRRQCDSCGGRGNLYTVLAHRERKQPRHTRLEGTSVSCGQCLADSYNSNTSPDVFIPIEDEWTEGSNALE